MDNPATVAEQTEARQTKSASKKTKLPRSLSYLKKADASVKTQLGAAVDLPTFMGTVSNLSLEERQTIVQQALILLERLYVHLPFKQAMHAVNPIQRLKLLQYRLENTPENELPSQLQFHNEMTEIFNSVRDLHTNYLLPAPFKGKSAFLPFLVEEYYEGGQRRYLVSKVATGFSHPSFVPGVEVLSWNGVPVERAIEVNGERQAGSNLAAQYARGLASLTNRPLVRSLPPDEDWVTVGYRALDGRELELRHHWAVFPSNLINFADDSGFDGADQTALAVDVQIEAIQQARKLLYAPKAVEAAQKIAQTDAERAAPPNGIDTSMPTVLRAQEVNTPRGRFAYVRIFTFNVNPVAFINEFLRLVESLPQNGLIIDVRANGGGQISAAEGLLQLLTPRRIEGERFQFVSTPMVLELCRLHGPSTSVAGLDLTQWVESIAQSVQTGSTFSLGFPITTEEFCNALGQRYYGPVVLITDALCYSATDMFAAGFQDHEVGKVLGTSANTGAGGANVWDYSLLTTLMQQSTSPFKALPGDVNMRIAIRRSLRAGEKAGTPLEDLGVEPDERHDMTRDDLLEGNVDLIERAASILDNMPTYQFSITAEQDSGGNFTVTATTQNISRLDLYVNDRPLDTRDVTTGPTEFTFSPPAGPILVEVRGYDGNRPAAVRRFNFPAT